MRILDILNAPWAMAASRVQDIRELYYAHTRREKVDLKAWEAATGRPAGVERSPYQLQDGVAIVAIEGVMTKVDSAWNRLCGMTSSQLAQQDLQTALDDPRVSSIILKIDSPGGMVDGTQELAQAVFAARQQKPIVALADGCMCSAAYWVGGAAEQVFITSDTTEVGSIGVVAAHRDVSGAEAQAGVKTTEITAGAYKRIASSFAPLTEDGRSVIKAQVDYIYSVFVDSVAQYRGVSVETVLTNMADGRVFLGRQAVEAGLVDGVSTLADLVKQLNQDRMTWSPSTPAAAGAPAGLPTTESQEIPMEITREKLAAESPELLQAIQAEGASAELARVQGCLAAATPGYEAMAKAAAFDGKTHPGELALAILAKQNADLAAAHVDATDEAKGAPALPTAGDPAAIEAAASLAAAEAKQDTPDTAQAHAEAIRKHVSAEATKGRNITAAQASAELARKGAKE